MSRPHTVCSYIRTLSQAQPQTIKPPPPLVDARKTSLTGVQNSTKKIGSPLRGSWTMLRIVVGSNPSPPPLEKS